MPLPDHTSSPRLTLRRWELRDAEVLEALVADNVEHLRPWMPWIAREPLGLEGRRELITGWEREWLDEGSVVMGAFLDGEPVGSTGLHTRVGPTALEIGYWVSRRHLRQGYATEISSALTSLAFTVDRIEVVEIRHDIGNLPSSRVPAALGFVDGGELTSDREDPAPAACGTDRRWFVDRARWPTPQATQAAARAAS